MGFRNPLTSLSASQITAGTLPPGVVLPASQVAPGALVEGVVARALADGTVTPQALAAGAVTGTKIAAGAVMADAIGAGQVFATKIAAGAVEASKIAAGAVTADKVEAGAITAAKVAAGAITAEKVAAGAITAEKVEAGAITAAKIATGAITADRLSVGVMSTNLLANPGFEDTGQAVPTPGVRNPVPFWFFTVGQAHSNGENIRWGADQFPPRSGNGYALLSNNGGGGGGSGLNQQGVPIVPGYQYRLSAYARTSSGEANNYLLALVYWSFNGGSTYPGVSYSISPVLTTTYSRFTHTTGVMPAGVTHARAEVRHFGNNGGAGGAGYVLVDDVALVRVGSPAVEITPAGFRAWDAAGNETISLTGQGGRISAVAIDAITMDAAGYIDIGTLRLQQLGSRLRVAGGFDTNGTSFLGEIQCGNLRPSTLSTTNTANLYQSASGGTIQRATSLRRFKLDREPVAPRYELLDVPSVTWRDAAEVQADPDTVHRIAGFVAEDVQAISAAHGGTLDALLTRDENGELQGLAYDRWPAYLVPIIADVERRLRALEDR